MKERDRTDFRQPGAAGFLAGGGVATIGGVGLALAP